jgi:recombination protein RecT
MAVQGKGNQDLKNQLTTQAQAQVQGGNFQSMIQAEFKKIFPAVQSMVPKHMTPERLMRVSLAAISRTPKLATCTPESLVGAVTACAVMGLEPDLIGHAYLVPFWNGKTHKMECQFQVGYRGYINLVRNSGDVDKIDALPVYENDLIVYVQGTESFIIHFPYEMAKNLNEGMFAILRDDDSSMRLVKMLVKGALQGWESKNPQNQGDITAYYSYYKLKSGGSGYKVMSKPEVEKHRDQFTKSKDKDTGAITGPWKDNFDAMALKTVIKQMVKFMPMTIEVQEHLAKDEAIVTFNQNKNGMNEIDLFNVDYSVLPSGDEPENQPTGVIEGKLTPEQALKNVEEHKAAIAGNQPEGQQTLIGEEKYAGSPFAGTAK